MSASYDIETLSKSVTAGDRVALAKAITLVESTKDEHIDLASKLVSACLSQGVKSRRIGITGVPGVGKSTFIEAIGSMVLSLQSAQWYFHCK